MSYSTTMSMLSQNTSVQKCANQICDIMTLYYAPGAGFTKELLRGAIQYFRAVYNISIDLFRNGLCTIKRVVLAHHPLRCSGKLAWLMICSRILLLPIFKRIFSCF